MKKTRIIILVCIISILSIYGIFSLAIFDTSAKYTNYKEMNHYYESNKIYISSESLLDVEGKYNIINYYNYEPITINVSNSISENQITNYDIENTSCNGFLSRLKSCIDNKNFSITLNEIKSYTLRFNNNFDLFILCADYLLSLEIERNERNLLESIVSYFKKAMSLYNFHTSKDISIYDINLFIIKTYTLYNKYELAMEYMEETKVYDKVSLAECKYKLKKYKDASIIVSDIYISAISDILSSKHMQIRILLKENKELEAYELTNWVLDFIDTIRKKEALFTDIKITYMYLKLVCEKKLKKDYLNSIKQLKEMVNNVSNDLENTDNIKFYYGENCTFYTTVKDYKKKIKEELFY